MRHIKYINEAIVKRGGLRVRGTESQEIETFDDLFQEIKDEGYTVSIRVNQRRTDNGDTQYDINVKGVSNEFSDEAYYNKNYDVSKMIIYNIERLENMGYEIIYRSINNTLTNSITSLECKIQFWSRK
jgi:hypothetical protein